MRKIEQFVLMLLSLAGVVHAQSTSTGIRATFKIGDHVPDILIEDIRNYKTSQAKLSDFKGKLIILDFWGVNCSPCLKAFPKMENLQREFNGKIQIILVNELSQKEIDSMYNRRRVSSALHRRDFPDLPSVTGDTMLHTLFRHRSIPHYVWIDKERSVRAITGSNEVTSENIQAVLLDDHFTLREKNDFLSFNTKKAFFPQIYGSYRDRVEYYSSLIKYIPGLPGSMRFVTDTLRGTIRISRTGSILELYSDALTGGWARGHPFKRAFFDFGKRVILDVTDSSRFFWNEGNSEQTERAWQYEHRFHYELVLPIMPKEQAYRYYLNDLNRFFHLEGEIKRKTLQCMALIRTSNKDKIKYPGNSRALTTARTYTDSTGVYHLKGSSLKTFRRAISAANRSQPFVVVDNTGYEGVALLEIHSSLSDIPRLREELRNKYDLDLVPTRQEVAVMVITEK